MNTLITGLALFALGVGVSVLILIWHKYRLQRIRFCTRPSPHICKVNGPCNGWPKQNS